MTQGQATSGQLYSVGIQPLNKEFSALAHLHLHAVLAAYIDDVKTQTSAALIERIIDTTQIRDGPAYRALLKMEKHRILLEVCATDETAIAIQRRFHHKFHTPLNRILIHPANIADLASKAEGRLLYGDVILGIPASPFPEFIAAFVAGEVSRISTEWRLAAECLKDEPHHLWYLLKHILGSKFSNLFRGIAPEFSQPLADCLTQLHHEILAQCESIPDLSFNLARIREGAGLGFADDILECAFAASRLTCLRSIEAANPGFSETVQDVVARGEEHIQHLDILLPARQFAAALLAVDPAFSVEECSSKEYGELRKLQGQFLLPRKEERTAAVESQIRQNNAFSTIYQSGKSVEARAWLDATPSQRSRHCRRRNSAQRSAIGSSFRISSSLRIRPARVARTSTATVFTPRSAARMVT